MKILWWIQLILATFLYVPDECADASIKVDEALLPRDTETFAWHCQYCGLHQHPFKIRKNADNENKNPGGQTPWIKRKIKSDFLWGKLSQQTPNPHN